MNTFTLAQVQQYVRIALYVGISVLGTYGYTVDGKTQTVILTVAGIGATLMWTVYGTRFNALFSQIASRPEVAQVITATTAAAMAIASQKVVSVQEVQQGYAQPVATPAPAPTDPAAGNGNVAMVMQPQSPQPTPPGFDMSSNVGP